MSLYTRGEGLELSHVTLHQRRGTGAITCHSTPEERDWSYHMSLYTRGEGLELSHVTHCSTHSTVTHLVISLLNLLLISVSWDSQD